MPNWISNRRIAGHGRGTPAIAGGDGHNVAVVSDASANTKGLWIEITDNVGPGVVGWVISAQNHGANSAWALDIAIGPVGEEVIIASNVPIEFGRALNIHDLPMVFPIRIPDNARVSIRGQSSNAGPVTINLYFAFYTGNLGPVTYSGCICPSLSEANTRGVIITSTAIFQLVASAAEHYKGVMFMSGADGGVQAGANLKMEYFVGASASEKAVFQIHFREIATGDTAPHFGYTVHRPIPYQVDKGSRWSTRATRANKFVNNIMFFF